jgi:c-di-GMP-binding flagellar brake protein YcgR
MVDTKYGLRLGGKDMKETRHLKRIHVISYLKIQEKSTDKELGRVVDMTAEGMGLYSQDPLETNSMVKLKLMLPSLSKNTQEIAFDAQVVWCAEADHPGFYDSGIKLLNVPQEDLEILENFIEESSVEDRWLMVDDSKANWTH